MISIKVLGPGCAKCTSLLENVKLAVAETGVEATVEKIAELRVIMSYGVLNTPGLVIDEKVVSVGRTLTVDEIKKHIKA